MTEALQFFDQPLARHTALVIAQVGFIHVCRWILTIQAQRAADRWVKDFRVESADKSEEDNVEKAGGERIRLNQQLLEIKKRARHHLDVTIFFYTRYYMAISLFAIVGGIAAIALLFITRFGWSGVSPYVISIFLVMSGHAAFYGAFPRIFRQEQNIADNKKLYVRYIGLQNEMESYFTTGEAIDGKKLSEGDFIHHIDQHMAKLHTFAIGFDSSKVPSYKDALEGVK